MPRAEITGAGAAPVLAPREGPTADPRRNVCLSCIKALRDVPRSRWDRISSRVRFQCPRCGRYSARIHSRWGFALKAALTGAALAGLVSLGLTGDFRGMLSRAPAGLKDETFMARGAFAGQLVAAEAMTNGKPRPSLTNDEVIELWRMKASTSLILHLIQSSKADFDFSTSGLMQLREAQLDPAIVEAMDKAN